MDQPLIHDADSPDGRPATDDELASILGQMATFDGASIYDLYLESRDKD
jgi:hypothetical protein